jgi:hypothetical protein
MIQKRLYLAVKLFAATCGLAIVGFFVFSISSCGKGNEASPEGLNIEYEVLNLSPDLNPIDLFINYAAVNTNPFIYGVNQGYFYVPSIAVPYQVRQVEYTGTNVVSLNTPLASGAKYSLFLSGSFDANSLDTLVTVDTATAAPLGHGKLRFVNLSPTTPGGLDLYANGTKAFSAVTYNHVSSSPVWQTLPAGNYDIQIDATGTTTILSEMSSITVQDGRLYTVYAYGYTTRTDTAAFNTGIITNQ